MAKRALPPTTGLLKRPEPKPADAPLIPEPTSHPDEKPATAEEGGASAPPPPKPQAAPKPVKPAQLPTKPAKPDYSGVREMARPYRTDETPFVTQQSVKFTEEEFDLVRDVIHATKVDKQVFYRMAIVELARYIEANNGRMPPLGDEQK